MIEPGGCRWCGVNKQSHYSRWQKDVSWHQWIVPTNEQIKQRMIERRNAKHNLRMSHLPSSP